MASVITNPKKLAASLIFLASLIVAVPTLAQNAVLQAGPTTAGDMPMYSGSGNSQPIVVDGGSAAGGTLGSTLGQIGITARSQNGVYPAANSGKGPLAAHACIYDAPTSGPSAANGYHYLCMDPNAAGGGLLAYGAAGIAAPLPLNFIVNGVTYLFPFTASGVTVQLLPGTSSLVQSGNATLINSAISAANAGGVTGLWLPAGDYYYNSTIIPKSNVSIRSAGVTTLHFTGSGSAIENSTTAGVLNNFVFYEIGLDAGTATNGVVLHAAYANHWRFTQMFQQNAAGTLFSLLSDVTTGATNANGNYNSAFNTIDHVLLSGGASYTGTCVYLSGAGSPTVPTGITTLNDFKDTNCLSVKVAGVNFDHWSDTNTFSGNSNFVVTGNNASGLVFNSSADATKTVYNEVFEHVSLAQYTALTGTTAIKMGYTRGIDLKAVLFDEFNSTQFSSLLSIDPTNTSSYRIVVHGNSPFGSEEIVTWQRYGETNDGPTGGLTQSLPQNWSQSWNNPAVAFTGFNFNITNTASGSGSSIVSWNVGGVSKVNFDPLGDANFTGALSAAGLAVSGQAGLNGGVTTSFLTLANPLLIDEAPTIASGFGTSPSISWNNGDAVFDVTVGTGGTASTGTINLNATAANGWTCSANDLTTTSSTVFLTKQTVSTTTGATFVNYNTSATPAAWTAGDHLRISCNAG